MENHLSYIVPSSSAVLFALLSTWVLFAVFVLSAVAFVMTIFGKLTPDDMTKKYLFELFSVSAVGIFVGLVTNNLAGNPATALEQIKTGAAREQAILMSQQAIQQPATASTAPVVSKMSVFVQIGSDEARATFAKIKTSLPADKYIVPPVDNVGVSIKQNDVRYCNPVNAGDAQQLVTVLKTNGLGDVKLINIQNCDPQKTKNVLEVWVKSI